MAFTPEDGTGLASANSYADQATADAYFADRGNATWAAAADTDKEQALVRATDYIDRVFGQRFIGYPEDLQTPQALEWPRLGVYRGVYPVEGVPVEVEQAAAEYAVRALSSDLLPDPEVGDSGRMATKVREKVGPIEESTEYAESSAVYEIRPYPKADRLLAPYLKPAGGSYR